MDAVQDGVGQRIMRSLQLRAASKQLRVSGARRDGEYRLSAVLANDEGGRALIEINHVKDGVVSSIRLIKFMGPGIAEVTRSVFVTNGEAT